MDSNLSQLGHRQIADLAKVLYDEKFWRNNVPEIIEQHNNVNREYNSILRQLISQMMEDPRNISKAIDVIWVIRAIEKIADHACYICDHIFYMHKSKFVRHSNKLTTSS